MNLKALIVFLVVSINCFFANSAVYQWSVPVQDVVSGETNKHPTAFLWIPENCTQVKAVIIGQHNMSEEDLFERQKFRDGLAKMGIAQIWISPAYNFVFDFNEGAGTQFENMMNALAAESGYSELSNVPVIPIGHSACASYPWNFAAWNPQRTLCVISQHGDAPLTNLTGSGRPNPDWGDRTIEGVPGIMIEGEYEWWEDRVQPALDYKAKYPKAPVSFLCDAGHGHFDVSDELVDYMLLFINKAVKYRLPKNQSIEKAPVLLSVNPEKGWLKERWKKDTIPTFSAAPFNKYKGDKKDAFWYFDKEIAQVTEAYYQRVRGKKEQFIGFTQKGLLIKFNEKSHARMSAGFLPQQDGLTFCFNALFTDTLRQKEVSNHAPGKPVISKICGPVQQVNDTTFSLRFFRMGMNNPKRTGDIWLLASHPGNEEYKSTVQQFNMRIPLQNKEGKEQTITFPKIQNQQCGIRAMEMTAKSTLGMPVYYYVKEGPAKIENGKLVFTKIPPRSKYPVKVTVAAWQYGRSIEPKIQTAEAVERVFYITKY